MRVMCLTLIGFALGAAVRPALPDERRRHRQDAPELSTALTDWSDGDNLPALQRLATLSRQGNRAARILLARIIHQAA